MIGCPVGQRMTCNHSKVLFSFQALIFDHALYFDDVNKCDRCTDDSCRKLQNPSNSADARLGPTRAAFAFAFFVHPIRRIWSLLRVRRLEVQTLVPDRRPPVLPLPQLVHVPVQPFGPPHHGPAAMAQLALPLRGHARERHGLAVGDEDGVPSESPALHGLDDGARASAGEEHGIGVRVRAEGEGAHRRRALVLVPDQDFVQALFWGRGDAAISSDEEWFCADEQGKQSPNAVRALFGKEAYFSTHVATQLVLEPLYERSRHPPQRVELEARVLHDARPPGKLGSLYRLVLRDCLCAYFCAPRVIQK